MLRQTMILLLAIASSSAAVGQPSPENASIFGRRNAVESMALSPDGTKIVFIQPTGGAASAIVVAAVPGGDAAIVARTDNKPWRANFCEWVSNQRVVCRLVGEQDLDLGLAGYSRLMAMDVDGKKITELGNNSRHGAWFSRQFDGAIIDYQGKRDGAVLMSRVYIPERMEGLRAASTEIGLGVDSIDTRSLKATRVEPPNREAYAYLSDGHGSVRIMATMDVGLQGVTTDVRKFYYRKNDDRTWLPFSTSSEAAPGLRPVAVNFEDNSVYAYRVTNGRDALYRVKLDGSMKETLVASHPSVDIDNVVLAGRRGRTIGYELVTDKRKTLYFDPAFGGLSQALARGLPKLPLVKIVDTSEDESKVLIHASSDVDPGRYYLFDTQTKRLSEIMLSRPELEGRTLATVKAVRFAARDGTQIPGYLTIPANMEGKNLPAIVMPHGGPAARDEWGFDWWAQYFAAQGFAVLQPNFRGSAGFGEDWFVENGFKSWKTAISDINDGGKWLVSQGIANPNQLAIVGWSYGGYAALQSPVVDSGLFKAIVAVAPVVDLEMFVKDNRDTTGAKLVSDYIGKGVHVEEGSPLKQLGSISVPVMMFSGDKDLNVDVRHAKAMDKALKAAGKSSTLTLYPGLEHSLIDSAARSDMLSKTDRFLRSSLGIK